MSCCVCGHVASAGSHEADPATQDRRAFHSEPQRKRNAQREFQESTSKGAQNCKLLLIDLSTYQLTFLFNFTKNAVQEIRDHRSASQ
jgi:hypothetical protein